MKKIFKKILISLVSIALVIAAVDILWINMPKLTSRKDIDDIEEYSSKVEDLSIDKNTRVIGLGEATHGNVEFQDLKLEVLKHLVENHGLKSFALETDFGEGLMINNYIHGDKKDENISKIFSFEIYHTENMNKLINWMFDYNQNIKDDKDKLSFYGIDMQNPEKSIELVTEFCKSNGILTNKNLEKKFSFINEQDYEISKIKENEDLLKNIKSQINKLNTNEAKLLSRSIVNILDSVNYYEGDINDYLKMNNMRDKYMANNTKWISDFEKNKGNNLILISGHNGHIAKEGELFKTLGSNLKDIFNDSYKAIGTDFYKSTVNINIIGPDYSRSNQTFTSANPLAYQAKKLGGTYLLNFETIKEGKTHTIISSDNYMGSLGEGYSPIMKLIPTSYRSKDKAINLYDSMIFVYEANPIKIL